MDPAAITFNTLFTKAPSSLAAADADVVRPAHVRLLDYEVELGLVMRRPLSGPRQRGAGAAARMAGRRHIVNGLFRARCATAADTQFYKGKSYRGFGPAGPFLLLLTPAEWRRWPELRMRLHVNGQPRQEALCGDMLFKPHQTLTELSALHDMQPGDLIATGTPAGCAARAPGKLVLWIMRHLLSDATKWHLFIPEGPAQPGPICSRATSSMPASAPMTARSTWASSATGLSRHEPPLQGVPMSTLTFSAPVRTLATSRRSNAAPGKAG